MWAAHFDAHTQAKPIFVALTEEKLGLPSRSGKTKTTSMLAAELLRQDQTGSVLGWARPMRGPPSTVSATVRSRMALRGYGW